MLGALAPLSAQDLTITNARVIGPNATVIERGSIVVRDGKIVSAAAGAPSSTSGKVIDAKGMSAMPGFIDAHRHINTGPSEKTQMQAQLEAGYTTILSGGGPADGNITLRDNIESGRINGPRILPSGQLRLNRHTPESAREEIRKMAAMGVKFTGEIQIMGPNTASYIQMGDRLGTIEVGKIADIILLDGDPLEGYWNWLKTKVTIKGGVVVDKRYRASAICS